MARANDREYQAVATALGRARDLLPPTASSFANVDPLDPGSINTLASFSESIDQMEYEVALYSLAGIAKGSGADQECWRYIEEAARLMRFGPRERARAFLSGGSA